MTNRRWGTGAVTLFVLVSGGCADEPGGVEEIASAVSCAPLTLTSTPTSRETRSGSRRRRLRARSICGTTIHSSTTSRPSGRTCGTCHQEALGWTITPGFARSRRPTDPLFAFDGSDCLAPGVANHDPAANSTEMLSKALIRIDLAILPTADYVLVSAVDPLGCPTPPSAADLRMYRRPLPIANTAFVTTVMWDGRENVNPPNNTSALILADLAHQSNDATRGHAQATADLSATDQVVDLTFEPVY